MKSRQSTSGGRKPECVPGFSLRSIPSVAWLAMLFGLFLGLGILKFGNPVILDEKVGTPANAAEAWNYAWPTRWAYWGLLPLLGASACFWARQGFRLPRQKWLWLLPLIWFGWQLVSATRTVDVQLTQAVLWHFGGCVGCFLVGLLVFSRERVLPWLLAGVLAAFAWCLVRAANQRLIEFPREHADLIAGEQTGWTNFPPELVLQLKANSFIITTNGVDVANPVILAKYAKGRVHGTMVYPNALAGLIILLLPVSLVLASTRTGRLRLWIRGLLLVLVLFLGLGGLCWTGSKLGWLVALGLVGGWLLRFDWPKRLKMIALVCVIVGGLGLFAWRFQNYFSAGAKSVGARFDYWRAAAEIFVKNPVFGTGPGTFQRPYAELKSPESEMARLTHNDYLEQFSDSGLIGGLTYLAWIGLALASAGRVALKSKDLIQQAVVLGLAGWFLQGFGEFSLYVPALAWMALLLLGNMFRDSLRNAMDTTKTGP